MEAGSAAGIADRRSEQVSWEEYTAAARELAKLCRADAKQQRQLDRDAAAERKLKIAHATGHLTASPSEPRPHPPPDEY